MTYICESRLDCSKMPETIPCRLVATKFHGRHSIEAALLAQLKGRDPLATMIDASQLQHYMPGASLRTRIHEGTAAWTVIAQT
jgi:hypothetical protein